MIEDLANSILALPLWLVVVGAIFSFLLGWTVGRAVDEPSRPGEVE